LQRCRDHLEKHAEEDDIPVLREHHHVLKKLIGTARYRERVLPRHAQTAWARLREELNRTVEAHRLESELLRVRGYVEDLQYRPPVLARPDSIHATTGRTARPSCPSGRW
jgi:hypothetical protein